MSGTKKEPHNLRGSFFDGLQGGLCKRILGGIEVALREVVVDLVNGDAHVLENLPEILALMAEHDGAVVWVVLLDEDVTIEAAHVLDTEDTDRTE